MGLITVAEMAEKWEISPRRIQLLCSAGRIAGAQKRSRLWLIPSDAQKPVDPRGSSALRETLYLPCCALSSCMPMPTNDADRVLQTLSDSFMRAQYEGELAYHRGDWQRAKRCFSDCPDSSPLKLCACTIANAAAISSGDYAAYSRIDGFLRRVIASAPESGGARLAELSLSAVAMSMFVPEMTADWIKHGDLEALPAMSRPLAIYIHTKYLQSQRHYHAMLSCAQTALLFCRQQGCFTTVDIYLLLMCSSACLCTERRDDALKFLRQAMSLGLSNGIITPFSENVTALGGVLQECLEREFPQYYDAVMGQCESTWKNWLSFHNRFARDNIALVLTLREYQLAQMLAMGKTYSEIAKNMHLSEGRVKNIVSDIYSKLMIKKKSELHTFVL